MARTYKRQNWSRPADAFLGHWAHLYTDLTKSEYAIEPAIAALGVRYRSQHPIFAYHYIVDFALLDSKVIIEVDGKSHRGPVAKAADRERTLKLERLGWVVVRCTNEEAEADPATTVQKLLLEAQDRRNALNLLKGITNV